jgi:hypothetical protein
MGKYRVLSLFLCLLLLSAVVVLTVDYAQACCNCWLCGSSGWSCIVHGHGKLENGKLVITTDKNKSLTLDVTQDLQQRFKEDGINRVDGFFVLEGRGTRENLQLPVVAKVVPNEPTNHDSKVPAAESINMWNKEFEEYVPRQQ